MSNRQPIPVTEIVAALEREAANTDTDPRWLAAVELRRMVGWESRSLMCGIDQRPSQVHAGVACDCGRDARGGPYPRVHAPTCAYVQPRKTL